VPKWRSHHKVFLTLNFWTLTACEVITRRAITYGVPLGLGDDCELPAGGETPPLKPLLTF
jgi:hypothetical protein